MIYHIALPGDWAAAQAAGEYGMSARGVSLAQEGFIHASANPAQLAGVRLRHYADLADSELRVLVIDETRLTAQVRYEGVDELFPHIYGPIPVNAVVEVLMPDRLA